MLATGNSSNAAINLVKNKGVSNKDIFLVSLLAAPEGLKNIKKHQKGQNMSNIIIPNIIKKHISWDEN